MTCRGYPDENARCTACGWDEDAHIAGRVASEVEVICEACGRGVWGEPGQRFCRGDVCAAGRVAADVPRKMLPERCICSDHSCYCRDYAKGWNDALDAVAGLTAPARTPPPDG